MKNLSSKQRRIAAGHMVYYNRLMGHQQRGIITYGGGLDILDWIHDAEEHGFHCTLTPCGVVLR